jgi:hypothetical protein
MDLLIEALPDEGDARRPTRPLAAELTRWATTRGAGTDPATALRAVLAWSRLHGFVSLEIAGNYASMGIDPDRLFEAELRRLDS